MATIYIPLLNKYFLQFPTHRKKCFSSTTLNISFCLAVKLFKWFRCDQMQAKKVNEVRRMVSSTRISLGEKFRYRYDDVMRSTRIDGLIKQSLATLLRSKREGVAGETVQPTNKTQSVLTVNIFCRTGFSFWFTHKTVSNWLTVWFY